MNATKRENLPSATYVAWWIGVDLNFLTVVLCTSVKRLALQLWYLVHIYAALIL
jgi:hypothetical protein